VNPEGVPAIAQGNALGDKTPHILMSLKGLKKVFNPYRVEEAHVFDNPRALPWAIDTTPLGSAGPYV